jgi:hypothetical protein
MKRLSLIAALLLVPALGAQSNDTGIRSRILPNGLEVLVIENHAVPIGGRSVLSRPVFQPSGSRIC